MKHLLLFCAALLVSIVAVAQWVPVGNPGFSAGAARYTSLAIDNGVRYVAYRDGGNANKATVMKYDGAAWVPVGNPGFSAASAGYTSLAIDNGVPYVAYQDDNIFGFKATVMKYDGAAWVPVGSPAFSTRAATYTSLAVYNGVPYVAYGDEAVEYKATVMKYDGAAWVPVGNPGFSAASAWYTSLAIDNGIPYVAYSDAGNANKATVMKYDGTNWVPVGNPGFSAGRAWYISLTSYNGVPYVAYQDGGNANKATVMKYDGTNWVPVGNPGFSAGESWYTSLTLYNGMPYVAYSDFGNRATVMTYNGAAWIPVGSPGFSTGQANDESLAIYNGVPYVAYGDAAGNGQATVMTYYTVATGSLSGAYCPGATLNVSYAASGYFSSNNAFTAQLSDASGSFATPVTIGIPASTNSGTIQATIPSNTQAGSRYRIRVVASNPAIIGSDNGQDLTVSQLNTYYEDKDGDTYGNAAVTKLDCSQPSGYVTNNTDCDDSDPDINYIVWVRDGDVDGYYTGAAVTQCSSPGAGYVIRVAQQSGDCDDGNAAINPNTVWVKDEDGDSYYTGSSVTQCTSPGTGYVIKNNQQAGDCNDNDPGVHNSVAYYRDADGDGYGSSVSAPSCSSTAPAGYSARTGDLNDNDPAISPGAVEVCGNKVDDNCNGVVDEIGCYACQNGTNLTTTSIASNSAQLNWNATANPQQWQLQYKTTATGSKWVDVLLTGNIRSVKISSLKTNQTYNWHIRAKCNGKWTDYSSSVAFKTAGCISSIIVSSAVAANPSTLSLYPNPTSGQFVVELNVASKINTVAKIQLTDWTGRIVQTENAEISYGSLKKPMNISSALSKGIYMVRITANGKVYIAKLVYEK